jgi:hypothetical protein
MWSQWIVGLGGGLSSVIGLVKSLRFRGQPEPPNRRWKLPMLIVFAAVFLAFAVIDGGGVVLGSVLTAILLVEIGFILGGRNPWWMQSPRDRNEHIGSPPYPNESVIQHWRRQG